MIAIKVKYYHDAEHYNCIIYSFKANAVKFHYDTAQYGKIMHTALQ